jgi:hypothetical protein
VRAGPLILQRLFNFNLVDISPPSETVSTARHGYRRFFRCIAVLGK